MRVNILGHEHVAGFGPVREHLGTGPSGVLAQFPLGQGTGLARRREQHYPHGVWRCQHV